MMKLLVKKHNRMLFSLVLLLIVAALNMTGCGGGGGGGGTPTTPTDPTTPTTSASIKGFWAGTQGATATSAIILANGDSWLVFQESGVVTKFARLQTTTNDTSFSSSGYQYLLQSGVTEVASASGNFIEKVSITATSGSNNLNLTYNSQYELPASSNGAVGSWKGTYGGGSSTLTMNISSTGLVTGSSTTGCSYTGSILPRTSDPAVFDLAFTENCIVGTAKGLAGIATVNAEKTSIFFAVTTADRIQGALFSGEKQ